VTIVEFLRARLADDEAAAPYAISSLTDWGEFVRYDPARVLREVAAKRAIIRLALSRRGAPPEESHVVIDEMVGALASVYADHPDFDPAWSVDATATV
jgi:Family of unknown function (DUF6221)